MIKHTKNFLFEPRLGVLPICIYNIALETWTTGWTLAGFLLCVLLWVAMDFGTSVFFRVEEK